MDYKDLRQKLLSQGYCIVPAVLGEGEVADLRNFCCGELRKAHSDAISGTDFLNIPRLAAIPFSQPVTAALRGVLGENFVIVPEFTMQSGRSGPWHFDASSHRDASWLNDPDYLQVQLGIYLQANHPDYAGGLAVIPKSHRVPFSFFGFGSMPARIMRWFYRRFGMAKTAPARPGDLLIFDFRLLHRGIPPRVAAAPEAFRKYAIFSGAANSGKYGRLYMQVMKKRGDAGDPFYRDSAGIRFPDSYPPDIVERCQKDRIEVATL